MEEQEMGSNANGQRYWFSAKRWGIGWGTPETWEGWAVFVTFLAIAAGDGLLTLPHSHTEPATIAQLATFATILALDISVFLAIAVKTGAPMHRHFGKDKR